MAKVAFTIPGDVPNELAAQVPVDVFDRQLMKAATGRAGADFDLEAGIYGARALLPDGRELGVAFRVEESEAPLQFDMSYVAALTPVRDDPMRSDQPEAPGGAVGFTFRVLAGNPFLGLQRVGPWQVFRPDHPFSVFGGERLQAVEVRSADPANERHVMVPVQPGEWRRVSFGPAGASGTQPHMIFDDPELELLVRYLGAGMVGSAADMARSRDGLARRALSEERRPMGATLGAYVLLQAAGPQAVAEFTETLPERFPWLPDARVLRAEVLARQGRHADAVSELMTLRALGPPIFSSGLSYALNRMRQYALRLAGQAPGIDVRHFTEFAAQLDWLAARTDFDRPILTYRPPAAPTLSTLTSNAVHTTLRSAAGILNGFRRRSEPST